KTLSNSIEASLPSHYGSNSSVDLTRAIRMLLSDLIANIRFLTASMKNMRRQSRIIKMTNILIQNRILKILDHLHSTLIRTTDHPTMKRFFLGILDLHTVAIHRLPVTQLRLE